MAAIEVLVVLNNINIKEKSKCRIDKIFGGGGGGGKCPPCPMLAPPLIVKLFIFWPWEALDFSNEIRAQQEGCCTEWLCTTDFRHLEFIARCSIFVGVHGCLSKVIATKCLVAPSLSWNR